MCKNIFGGNIYVCLKFSRAISSHGLCARTAYQVAKCSTIQSLIFPLIKYAECSSLQLKMRKHSPEFDFDRSPLAGDLANIAIAV